MITKLVQISISIGTDQMKGSSCHMQGVLYKRGVTLNGAISWNTTVAMGSVKLYLAVFTLAVLLGVSNLFPLGFRFF